MSTGNYPPGGTWEIDNGWEVKTSDGEKIGEVEEVHPHYLVVGKGLIFHSERYVPVSTITDVRDDTVLLGVTKAEVEQQGWDTIPDVAETSGTTQRTDTTRRMGTTDYDRRDGDDMEVPVVEEQLNVDKRQVDRGSVRVHKDVVEEDRQVNVPVREERVRVERHAVADGEVDDVGEHTFQEEDIEIPVRGEEVNVSKRPVVTEHVHIDKDVEERDEQATGTVRREQVHVEGQDQMERGDRP